VPVNAGISCDRARSCGPTRRLPRKRGVKSARHVEAELEIQVLVSRTILVRIRFHRFQKTPFHHDNSGS
jgi:hypothetical protein